VGNVQILEIVNDESMPEPGYKSVRLPEDLLNDIDSFLRRYGQRLGYTSKAEFIKAAIRGHLEREEIIAERRIEAEE